jgi:hypothetical protein
MSYGQTLEAEVTKTVSGNSRTATYSRLHFLVDSLGMVRTKKEMRSQNHISYRTTCQPPVWEIEKCDREALLLSADRSRQNQNFNRLLLLMNDNIVAINFN